MPKLFDLNKNNPYVNSFLKLPKSADDFKKKKENKQLETIQKEKTNADKSIDDLMSQVNLLEKVERRTPAFTESGGVYVSNAKQKQALRNEINSLNSAIKRKATTLSREELEERIKNNENRKFQLNAPMATTNRSSVKDYSTILEIGRLTNENNMYKEALEIRKKEHPEEKRKANIYDLTVSSAIKGFNENKLGLEYYKMMNGKENNAKYYEDNLKKLDDYEIRGLFQRGISGASKTTGQQVSNTTDPRVANFTLGYAGATAVAGNLGPQAIVPEEILTVPSMAVAGYKTGSSIVSAEAEAGFAYKEMIDLGVSHDTAKMFATGVGIVNGIPNAIPFDELIKSFKVLNKRTGTKSVAKKLYNFLDNRLRKIGAGTVVEDIQEATTMEGANIASRIDKGDWAYSWDEKLNRIKDTTNNALLTFSTFSAADDAVRGINRLTFPNVSNSEKAYDPIRELKKYIDALDRK